MTKCGPVDWDNGNNGIIAEFLFPALQISVLVWLLSATRGKWLSLLYLFPCLQGTCTTPSIMFKQFKMLLNKLSNAFSNSFWDSSLCDEEKQLRVVLWYQNTSMVSESYSNFFRVHNFTTQDVVLNSAILLLARTEAP